MFCCSEGKEGCWEISFVEEGEQRAHTEDARDRGELGSRSRRSQEQLPKRALSLKWISSSEALGGELSCPPASRGRLEVLKCKA